jgi:hypothetical protein
MKNNLLLLALLTLTFSAHAETPEVIQRSLQEINQRLVTIENFWKGQSVAARSEGGDDKFITSLDSLFADLKQRRLLFRNELNRSLRPLYQKWVESNRQNPAVLAELRAEIDKSIQKVTWLRISETDKKEIVQAIRSLHTGLDKTTLPKSLVTPITPELKNAVNAARSAADTLSQEVNKLSFDYENLKKEMSETQRTVTAPPAVAGASEVSSEFPWSFALSFSSFILMGLGSLLFYARKAVLKKDRKIRLTHDLVLKKLNYPVICLFKGRPLYINPAAEEKGMTKENFSKIIIDSELLDDGTRLIELGDKKFYLEEEILDEENGIVLLTTKDYRPEAAPLEDIVNLKEVEKNVVLETLVMDGTVNLKSEFLIALEKSSYLFQIAGKVIHLDLTESPINCGIEASQLSKVFHSYFDTLYRLIRDDEGTHVYLSLTSNSHNLRLAAFLEKGVQAHQKVEKGNPDLLNKLASLKGELYGYAPQVKIHRFKAQGGFEFVLSFDVSDKWEELFHTKEINHS